MKERPILMNTEMVKAILEKRKTQTRRPIRWPKIFWVADTAPDTKPYWRFEEASGSGPFIPSDWIGYSPYGQPGGKLWVRETWGIYSGGTDGDLIPGTIPGSSLVYRATDDMGELKGWKPSLFMPRWASRITLETVHVKVERLQDITGEDCIKEGMDGKLRQDYGLRYAFGSGWNSLYTKKPEYQWEQNPWVWVIEFSFDSLL